MAREFVVLTTEDLKRLDEEDEAKEQSRIRFVDALFPLELDHEAA